MDGLQALDSARKVALKWPLYTDVLLQEQCHKVMSGRGGLRMKTDFIDNLWLV